jgi:conjugative transfer region lipoprotein (TIGR03751 family)
MRITNRTGRATVLTSAVIGALLTSGCSSTSPNVIPATGPDTLEVYENHLAGVRAEKLPISDKGSIRSVSAQAEKGYPQTDWVGYTRDAANEIDRIFPRLPNPELVVFVFPHINGKGRPIPGYSTTFLLYEKEEYALPGEVAP